MSPAPIAVFGDLNLDTTVRVARFPLEVGDTMFAIDGIEDLVGGAAANVASGLRALGNQVTFGAAIGTDRIGDLVLERLAALGVGPSQVRRDWPVTSRTVILVDAEGHRRCINDPKLVHQYRYPEEALPAAIGEATWVFVSTQNWCRHVARFARDRGCKVAVDLQAITGDDEYHRDFLRCAHAVVFSTERLHMHSHDFFRRLWRDHPVEIAAATHGAGGATLGLRGAGGGEEPFYQPAFEVGPVVDRTGAGDAFTAGFVDALARGRTPRQALTRGQLGAAWKIGRRGSTNGFPDAERLDELERRFPGQGA